ncbi:hypothetical protein [Methanobrevibacter sp.]|uniref:hypothetical protein n=1 Tax=Methanobrevibacter sp. TaxID=66852 RepID=UPI00388DDEDC
MRRKKDDKRVLVSPRDNRQGNSRRQRSRNPTFNKKTAKRNKKTVFIMILALVAFVIGAGCGISMSFDDHDDGPKWDNVTKEMTTNLNDTEPVYYDDELDNVDYNDNETISKLNISTEPSY